MEKTFKTSADFRRSLENRLAKIALDSNRDLQRLRRKVAFDRLLARLCCQKGSPFVLKGGYAMELRMKTARATKDIDLTCLLRSHTSNDLRESILLKEVRELARIDLKDYFVFEIGELQCDLEGAPYGGARYPVSSLVDGRLFVKFQLDVGADSVFDDLEVVKTTDWLSYYAIEAPSVRMISVEQQLAEKIHAYTRPRAEAQNTRVKDLIDTILLKRYRVLDVERFRRAIERVFRLRDTHPLPLSLEPPPGGWLQIYSKLANECGIEETLEEAYLTLNETYRVALEGLISSQA